MQLVQDDYKIQIVLVTFCFMIFRAHVDIYSFINVKV